MNKRWFGAIAALFGMYLIAYGFTEGEVETVFAKAIRICLECIGIG
ncbi:CD1871A family CXXC motif-containing protein [Oceanirhabdus sp. W0125-5]|nr:CD1871A family CXXC motif-containing protein [Oceanirhabdus sp. W0125-5]WBW98193.1 CD1871A family CXXC motif-containing protein [Oceanirhabdus sp. W0125-5]